jgi:hypothetical protein
MENNQDQLFIQENQDEIREQWLRKDLWSLHEFINLCCGSLDGTRPISPWSKKRFEEYKKRSKSQGTLAVWMPFDQSDLENEAKEPAKVVKEIIQRGIRAKELTVISLQDANIGSKLYGTADYFVPRIAIEWAESKLSLLPEFPLRINDLDNLQPITIPHRKGITPELEKWAHHDLWSHNELRDLCCGLEPDPYRRTYLSERIIETRKQHPPRDVEVLEKLNQSTDSVLLRTLDQADESIRRAVIADLLEPCMNNDDWKNQAYPQHLFFKPAVATKWASTRFKAFPFGEEDYPSAQSNDSINQIKAADAWKKRAQEIGEEYLENYGIKSGCQDRTLKEVSEYVAKQLKEEGLLRSTKTKKLISVNTIRRDALSCKPDHWYKQMIEKGLTYRK